MAESVTSQREASVVTGCDAGWLARPRVWGSHSCPANVSTLESRSLGVTVFGIEVELNSYESSIVLIQMENSLFLVRLGSPYLSRFRKSGPHGFGTNPKCAVRSTSTQEVATHANANPNRSIESCSAWQKMGRNTADDSGSGERCSPHIYCVASGYTAMSLIPKVNTGNGSGPTKAINYN